MEFISIGFHLETLVCEICSYSLLKVWSFEWNFYNTLQNHYHAHSAFAGLSLIRISYLTLPVCTCPFSKYLAHECLLRANICVQILVVRKRIRSLSPSIQTLSAMSFNEKFVCLLVRTLIGTPLAVTLKLVVRIHYFSQHSKFNR